MKSFTEKIRQILIKLGIQKVDTCLNQTVTIPSLPTFPDAKLTELLSYQKRYSDIVKKIRAKVKDGRKIRVCFFVMLDSTFACSLLFEKMLEDKFFEPYIVIIPDVSRGREHMINMFNQAHESLSQKYRQVYKGFDVKTGQFFDFSDKADLVCFPNPYENMTHEFFEIRHFLDKDILPFYVNYGFFTLKFGREIIKMDTYNIFWKVFVENNFNIRELKKYQILKGNNAVVTGYCKMDKLDQSIVTTRKNKVLILAPHHTVTDWKPLMLSSFLRLCDFYIKLPALYPDIHFVFRPHPLLVVQLKKPEIWGEKKTEMYLKKMESYPNVTYSRGGEYLDLFANSDGIIHSCGSFLAEYLFTGKPACYILRDDKAAKKWFLPLGKKCLEYCYISHTKEDIVRFINNVIIKGKDPLREDRLSFVNKTLKTNYPNASQTILDYLKKELT